MPSQQPQYPAIVVQRVDEHHTPDTTELKALAEAAGCTIVGELTQEREEDPEFEVGSGKVEELTALARETDATNIIFDGRLSPYQTYNLGLELPSGVEVIDRFLLVLRALETQADSHREQRQLELAGLRYELPRIEAKINLAKRDQHPGFMGLDDFDEEHETRIKDRISALKDELNGFVETDTARRTGQQDDGFAHVALAGYTNSGRSTLFRRLVPDMPDDPQQDSDIDTTVNTASTPLTTFEPTTRRMPHDRRDVLLTDTLGLVKDIPHWIYDSLEPSLAPIHDADVVVVTVDLNEPTPTIREKLITVHDYLRTESDASTITAFTKADRIPQAEQADKLDALAGVAPNPVVTSATTGTGLSALKERIDRSLPGLVEERLQLPLTDDTMGVVSWIHDNANVLNEDYTSDTVMVNFEGDPAIVKQARAKAAELSTPHPTND